MKNKRNVGLYVPALLVIAGTLLAGCPETLHRVEIRREIHFEMDAFYIAVAESVCPNVEDVLAVFNGDVPEIGDECLWWYTRHGALERVPFAVTGDAVDYYENWVLSNRTRHGIGQTHMNYHAKVLYSSGFEISGVPYDNVVSVVMSLNAGNATGPLSGGFFHKDRIVILDLEGRPLAILGDGPARLSVAKDEFH